MSMICNTSLKVNFRHKNEKGMIIIILFNYGIGGSRGGTPPPQGTQFFRFDIQIL